MIIHCLRALPVRFTAIHSFKKGTSQLQHTIEQLLHLFPPALRVRQCVHEVERVTDDDLRQFGFSFNMLPPNIGGTLEFDFLDWVENRRRMEQQNLQKLLAETIRTDPLF